MSFNSIQFIRRFSTGFKPKLKMSEELDSIQTIRREFQCLGSGSVDLQCNDLTGIAIITLSNEEKKNSLSGKMMSQFWEVIQQLQHWSQGKAVIIKGKNGFFSSGGDLNTVKRIADPLNGRKMSVLMHSNCTRLQSLPMISLAQIEGMALGGGAEIATSCDFRLMSSNAKIGFVHIRIGIVSAWGGGSRLSQLIGPQKALDLMLTGKTLSAFEAKELKLIDDILEESQEEDISQQTINWLKKYTENQCLETIKAVKNIVNGTRYLPLESSLLAELEHSSRVWGSESHIKGLNQNLKHNLIEK